MEMVYLKNVASLRLDVARCTGCGMCTEVCPHAVFAIEGRKASILDLDRCMECGACERNCPAGALSVRAGVGCAAALIHSALTGSEPSCGCSDA
jgi:NAD-dependent dihydropyrimidine dehydrogenase PreA subunit